ncbi:WD_REPEATS_REGION domain-containing protein [Psidium guajava]|nr:WD_REPEATS_REGION domain-containing protein [Psidium guajava]
MDPAASEGGERPRYTIPSGPPGPWPNASAAPEGKRARLKKKVREGAVRAKARAEETGNKIKEGLQWVKNKLHNPE